MVANLPADDLAPDGGKPVGMFRLLQEGPDDDCGRKKVYLT